MTTLHDVIELAAREHYLAVISTVRADGSVQASLVNVGALQHPVTGEDVVAFVTYGRVKLGNLRVRPQVTIAITAG